MERIRLNDGVEIPTVGFGVFMIPNGGETYRAVLDALKLADASLGVIIQPIDNAIRTLMPIKKAWDSIPVSAQQEASSKRTQEQWNVELNNAESMASGHV